MFSASFRHAALLAALGLTWPLSAAPPHGRIDARPLPQATSAVGGPRLRQYEASLRQAALRKLGIAPSHSATAPIRASVAMIDAADPVRPGAPAPPGPSGLCTAPNVPLTLEFRTDAFGEETTWEVRRRNGILVASGGPYDPNALVAEEVCIDPTRCYDVIIRDAFGDGILPPGYFEVRFDGQVVERGGAFGEEVQVRGVGAGCPPNPLVECDAGPGLSQRMHLPQEGWFAGQSEPEGEGANFIQAENFHVNGPICRVTWWGFWGFQTFFDFFACDEFDPSFDVVIYADNGGAPGAEACRYTVTTTGTPTGVFFLDQFEARRFDFDLPTCCNIRDGWISIQGKGDPFCWFFWLSAPFSDGISAAWTPDSPAEIVPGDFALCLNEATEPGACCNPFTADCSDGVEPGACPVGFGFTPGAACGDLNPVCGGEPGACCDDVTRSCTDGVLEANCAGRHAPGATCAELDPACGDAPGACCFDDGRACQQLSLPDCSAVGGAWGGVDVPCTTCPCVVGCPPGAIPEQDACGEDTNYGCFGDPPSFQDIQVGDTICGTGFADGDRDTDWYRFSISEPSRITVDFEGEFGERVIFGGIMEYNPGRTGSGDCADTFGGVNPVFNVEECEPGQAITTCLPAGIYFAFVSPVPFEDFPCGADNDYHVTVTAEPCELARGACCMSDGTCTDGLTIDACVNAGGFYQGDETACEGANCRQPQPGDSCFTPIVIAVPGDLPYAAADTNCERIDDHRDSCLGDYDDGEDIVWQLDVSEPVTVDIRVDPMGTPFTGLVLTDACPPDPNHCVAFDRATDGGPLTLGCRTLEPGTYYLMADTWPFPLCIPQLELSITSCLAPQGACCGGNRGCLGTMTQAECVAAGGAAWYEGQDCATLRCPAPAADVCDAATEIHALPFFEPGVPAELQSDDDNVDPTCDSDFSCNVGPANNGWWYTLTPRFDCSITVGVTGINSTTSLWSGADCSALAEVACTDDQSALFDLSAGVRYWILISNWSCSFEPVDPADVTITGACRVVCGDFAPAGGDGNVDLADYEALLASFARCEGQDGFLAAGDFDLDGCITWADVQEWVTCYRSFIGDPLAGPPRRVLGFTPKRGNAGAFEPRP